MVLHLVHSSSRSCSLNLLLDIQKNTEIIYSRQHPHRSSTHIFKEANNHHKVLTLRSRLALNCMFSIALPSSLCEMRVRMKNVIWHSRWSIGRQHWAICICKNLSLSVRGYLINSVAGVKEAFFSALIFFSFPVTETPAALPIFLRAKLSI